MTLTISIGGSGAPYLWVQVNNGVVRVFGQPSANEAGKFEDHLNVPVGEFAADALEEVVLRWLKEALEGWRVS